MRPLPDGVGRLEVEAGRATLYLDNAEYALEGRLVGRLASRAGRVPRLRFRASRRARAGARVASGQSGCNSTRGPSISPRSRRSPNLPAAPSKPFPPCPDTLGLVSGAAERGVGRTRARPGCRDGTITPQDHRFRRFKTGNRTLGGGRHEARGAAFYQRSLAGSASRPAHTACISGRKTWTRPTSNAIAEAGLRLGLSTHGYYEMLKALHFKPSYLALGAVFPTTTKIMPTAPQGLSRLARYVRLLDGIVPLVAIGGINGSVLRQIMSTGVGSAAVVRAVTEAPDLTAAVSALQHEFAR